MECVHSTVYQTKDARINEKKLNKSSIKRVIVKNKTLWTIKALSIAVTVTIKC